MDKERYSLRLALAVAACLIMLNFSGVLGRMLANPEIVSLIVYLETGRLVKLQLMPPEVPEETASKTETEPTSPATTEPPLYKPVFQPEDAQLIEVRYHWDCSLDTQAMLVSPLQWDLTQPQPSVLILHSHATESFTPTAEEPYTASSTYRTLDPDHNMVRVGETLKNALQERGIGVIHDTTLHDYPSYTDAYIRSRETAEAWLEKYPGILLVLDLHRDAAEMEGGGQLKTHAVVNGQAAAQLMLVVGTNAGGRIHPNWRQNMSLAMKLQVQLEKLYPGLCRPIGCRTERFNQDLSAGALLVEVGAAGDTLEEAMTAAEALAEAIAVLAEGTATGSSTS